MAASPAWKMASTNLRAARRRVWVRGRHTRTSSIRSDLSGLAKRLSPQSRTRRRAARTLTLATFHAGPAAASSVRRDTQAYTCWRQTRGPVQPSGSARKMPSLGPERHAQASERSPACPPWGAHAGRYRRRGGSEGRFPRNKGFTEREATLASAVATAPGLGEEPNKKARTCAGLFILRSPPLARGARRRRRGSEAKPGAHDPHRGSWGNSCRSRSYGLRASSASTSARALGIRSCLVTPSSRRIGQATRIEDRVPMTMPTICDSAMPLSDWPP